MNKGNYFVGIIAIKIRNYQTYIVNFPFRNKCNLQLVTCKKDDDPKDDVKHI